MDEPKKTAGAGPAVVGGRSDDNPLTSWVDSCIVAVSKSTTFSSEVFFSFAFKVSSF